MKKLIYLILLGLIVSSCNKPEKVPEVPKSIITVQIKYFDNTLDTLVINENSKDLNLTSKGEFYSYIPYISNPYYHIYATQVKTYKILKQ